MAYSGSELCSQIELNPAIFDTFEVFVADKRIAQDSLPVLGIIGGLSYESSDHYWREINKTLPIQRLGKEGYRENFHMPTIEAGKQLAGIGFNFNIDNLFQYSTKENGDLDWSFIQAHLVDAFKKIHDMFEEANLESKQNRPLILGLATNTLHHALEGVDLSRYGQFVHILDPFISEIQGQKKTHVILIGTQYTANPDNCYVKRLQEAGLTVVLPDKDQQKCIDDIIFRELCHGTINPESRQKWCKIIKDLVGKNLNSDKTAVGACCTEVGLLLEPSDIPFGMSFVDTTICHTNNFSESLGYHVKTGRTNVAFQPVKTSGISQNR